MKKLLSTLLALLLVLSAVCLAEADAFSTFDHVVGSAGGGRYEYYDFPDISLLIPEDWKGLYTVEQREDSISFYQTASYEKFAEKGLPGGGFLFELAACEGLEYQQLPAYKYLGYSENAKLNFYLRLPSDYPAYPEEEIMAEYNRMAEAIQPVVAEKARIRKSGHFYPGDVEIEDGNGLA
ncbi:MAG: hypothetical protein IJH86_05205 [Clostridia bacterium]|nr:hypothetical protein [Clostridia bacterium]